MISKSLKVSYNNSINPANTFTNMYCHLTDSGNATKLPDTGTQPANSGGNTKVCIVLKKFLQTNCITLA